MLNKSSSRPSTLSFKKKSKQYAGRNKASAKAIPGQKYWDNGYEIRNSMDISTSRSNSLNVTDAGATPRSVDSYPFMADLGVIYYNPVGIKYSYDSTNNVMLGNNVLSQIDIAATNINT